MPNETTLLPLIDISVELEETQPAVCIDGGLCERHGGRWGFKMEGVVVRERLTNRLPETTGKSQKHTIHTALKHERTRQSTLTDFLSAPDQVERGFSQAATQNGPTPLYASSTERRTQKVAGKPVKGM